MITRKQNIPFSLDICSLYRSANFIQKNIIEAALTAANIALATAPVFIITKAVQANSPNNNIVHRFMTHFAVLVLSLFMKAPCVYIIKY